LAWEQYRTVEFPFERLETPRFEMENRWKLNRFLDYMRTWSATDRCLKKLGDAWWSEAGNRIGALWGDPERERLVKMPLTLVVGRNWAHEEIKK